MQRYKIFLETEYGVHTQDDNLFIQIKIVDSTTNKVSSPSEVLISIYDPNSVAIVTEDDMNEESDGIYSYESTPTDSIYGKYLIRIKTINDSCLKHFTFVIFEWDIVSETRIVLGSYQQKDISDYKLSLMAWNAYIEILKLIDMESTNYDEELMHEAVAYLTAHKILLSLRNLDKATMADLQTNEYKIKDDAKRMKNRYLDIIEQITDPNISAGN